MAQPSIDIYLHATYFVVGHFHLVMGVEVDRAVREKAIALLIATHAGTAAINTSTRLQGGQIVFHGVAGDWASTVRSTGYLGVVAGACSITVATFNPAWPKAAEIAVCPLYPISGH